MEKRKFKFPEPKIGNRRIKLTRVVPAAALSIAMLTGLAGSLSKNSSNKNEKVSEKILHTEYKELDSVLNPELDDVIQTVYNANEEIILYVQEKDNMKPVESVHPNQEINVFNTKTEIDSFNTEYLYCELEAESIIGLIKKEDLSKATKKEERSVEFDSIYQITNPSTMGKFMQATIGKDGIHSGARFNDGDVIFVDEKGIQLDDEGNYWMKMRTNNGSIGYIKNDDSLKEINDGILVEVIDSNTVLDINTENLNMDVSNLITDVKVGSRLVVIGQGSNENLSRALYFDANGQAKWGEIANDLIKDVILVTSDERLSPDSVEKTNDIVEIDKNISNWNQDYKNGSYGIDISGMKPDALKQLLVDSPNIDYGIVRLGVTGYGHKNDGLKIVDSSTVTTNDYIRNLTQGQIDEFKAANVPVFAYFYATDINPEEGYKVAEYVEACIDVLDGDIQPIIDCELFEEGHEDRMYFITQPNYQQYLKNGGHTIDFEYLNSLSESELLRYVDSNDEVKDYIDYCQDLKAQSVAATYSKLYKDGYIKGKNALFYSGNKSISKDSYKATIKTGEDKSFDKIVLLKYDDLVEYLTNPDSPYFISEDFSLKVWYADYTGEKNHEMLGNGSAMTQYAGDVFVDKYSNLSIECYTDYFDTSFYKGIDVRNNSIYVKISTHPKNTYNYKYYINNVLKAQTSTNEYTYTGLSPRTTYTIKVEAVDNNEKVLETVSKEIKTMSFSNISSTKTKDNFSVTIHGIDSNIQDAVGIGFYEYNNQKIIEGKIDSNRNLNFTFSALDLTSTIEEGYYFFHIHLMDKQTGEIVEIISCDIIFGTEYVEKENIIDIYNLKENGNYQIIATDLAGNSTEKNIIIKK